SSSSNTPALTEAHAPSRPVEHINQAAAGYANNSAGSADTPDRSGTSRSASAAGPAAQPAETGRQPAARRSARPTLSGPAIGDLLEKPVGLYESVDDTEEEAGLPAADPGSAAKIESAREKFIKRLNATRPRLAMAFHSMKVDGNKIQVAVPTPDLLDEILRNRTEILSLLSETARINGYMQLEVIVREDVGPKKPVRVEDKLRFLTEKNPAINILRQKLDMDIE
ncbi:MAG: hypothetical protein LUD76_06700, partial [Alistipes sp.]|nr:hypothetical protein [Alistipes sp.]